MTKEYSDDELIVMGDAARERKKAQKVIDAANDEKMHHIEIILIVAHKNDHRYQFSGLCSGKCAEQIVRMLMTGAQNPLND